VITSFPAVCDALVTAMGQVLGTDVVFDGTPVRDVGPSGLAIGTTREDVSSAFSASAADLGGGLSEGLTVTCLAWAGSGDTVFKAARDRVGEIVTATTNRITADPTLGGVVDTADVSGGIWQQEQTGEGALVTCEFRILVQQY